MSVYERMSWDDIKYKISSSIILIDKSRPGSYQELSDIDENARRELLTVNTYISHDASTNENGTTGTVSIYKIIDRAIDNNGNLILITEPDYVKYSR